MKCWHRGEELIWGGDEILEDDFENNKAAKYLKSLGYDDPEERPEHVYLYRANDIFSTI